MEQEKLEMLSVENLQTDAGCGNTAHFRKLTTHKLEMSKPHAQLKPRNPSPGYKDPEPIKGWTIDQQQTLIKELRKNPKARKSADSLKELFLTVQSSMPEKSRHEIEECYRHLQANRIAYFCSSRE
jgi:hypothetical protein